MDVIHEYNEPSPAYYHNISGVIEGKWFKDKKTSVVPVKITIPGSTPRANSSLNSDRSRALFEHTSFSLQKPGNVTHSMGQLHVNLLQAPRKPLDYNVSFVEMSIDLSDMGGDDTHSLHLQGLHIKETGNLVLTTNSFKFSGVYALPHLLLSEDHFEESQKLVVNWLNRTTEQKLLDESDYGIVEDSLLRAHKCEYIVYAHIGSSSLSEKSLREIEEELKNPQGRPHEPAPSLTLYGVMYSPDCGIVLTSSVAKGEKVAVDLPGAIRVRRSRGRLSKFETQPPKLSSQ
jgi:hypothetical protein